MIFAARPRICVNYIVLGLFGSNRGLFCPFRCLACSVPLQGDFSHPLKPFRIALMLGKARDCGARYAHIEQCAFGIEEPIEAGFHSGPPLRNQRGSRMPSRAAASLISLTRQCGIAPRVTHPRTVVAYLCPSILAIGSAPPNAQTRESTCGDGDAFAMAAKIIAIFGLVNRTCRIVLDTLHNL